MCESYPICICFDTDIEQMETPVETIRHLSSGLGLPFDIMQRIIRYKDLLELVGTRIYLQRMHVTDEDAPPSETIRHMQSVFYPSDDNTVGMIFTIGKGDSDPDEYTCAEFSDVKTAVSALHELYKEHGVDSPDTIDKMNMMFIFDAQQVYYQTLGEYERYDLGLLENDMQRALFCNDLWPMIGTPVYNCQHGVFIKTGPKYVRNQYMTTSINYSVLHNWYSSVAFTPTTAVQYRYFVKTGGKFNALKFSNVSLEFDYINNKHGGQLKKIFNTPSNNKMYVQVVGSDLYFVVPTVDPQTNSIVGSHYSLHNIKNYSPDYNRTLVYTDTIDIHKTTYDDKTGTISHGPKCVIHNGMQVPMKSDGLKLDNAVCLNKRSGAHSFYSAVFSNQAEKDLVRDILSLPYQAKIASANRAATNIARAYRAHKAAKKTLSGGTDHEAVYVILIRVGNQWHKTYNMLDGSGAIVGWFHTVGPSIAQKTLLAEIKGFVAGI